MKLINILSGIIISAIGIAIGYVDYYIISIFYAVSLWVADVLNAPDAVAALLTLILIGMSWFIIFIIAVVALYVFVIGIGIAISKY